MAKTKINRLISLDKDVATFYDKRAETREGSSTFNRIIKKSRAFKTFVKEVKQNEKNT